jgi:SRSO17 transposase
VGVQRQWCGRLGKKENCQVGEFLAYASHKGQTLVDCRLYLPEDWAADPGRRLKTHVPPTIEFRKGWELALDMVRARTNTLPHGWISGDDSYGRVVALRDALDLDGERTLLEVPSNTQVAVVTKTGVQEEQSVADVARATPASRWQQVRTRDGEKQPIIVNAVKLRVETKRGYKGRKRETLLIVRRSDGEHCYYLSNAKGVSVSKMAKVAACRHFIEEALELGKGDAGLAEYEVRSWVGWHHHMTLSLLAMYFLVLEQRILKKNASAHGPADTLGDWPNPRPARGHRQRPQDHRPPLTNPLIFERTWHG